MPKFLSQKVLHPKKFGKIYKTKAHKSSNQLTNMSVKKYFSALCARHDSQLGDIENRVSLSNHDHFFL